MDALTLITMEPLDFASDVPLYQQLEQRVERLIASGALDATAPLPTELELTQQLGLSRATVRRCFTDLVQRKLVVRRRGRGTFVAAPSAQHGGPSLNFTQRMQAAGLKPSSRTLSFACEQADEDLARLLRIAQGEAVFHIVRLRLADGRPVTLDDVYVVASVCPDLSADALDSASLYALIAQRTGTVPARADETFEAIGLPKHEARHFDLPAGAPAFRIARTTYDAEDRPFELARTLAPGDRNRYELSSPNGLAM